MRTGHTWARGAMRACADNPGALGEQSSSSFPFDLQDLPLGAKGGLLGLGAAAAPGQNKNICFFVKSTLCRRVLLLYPTH